MRNRSREAEPSAYDHFCTRCGRVWTDRVLEPAQCPDCRSLLWHTEPEAYHCRDCAYMWTNRSADLPQCCPKCRSRNITDGPIGDTDCLDAQIIRMYESGAGGLRICMALKVSMTRVRDALRLAHPDQSSFRV